ncbi:hypothetical protein THRCLA_00481 [Thraustotheca clavata]|uniref:BRCT domain-containing protein n=1 Tax=Thraustotheca clavata TaxID=74557 RepID=A0A1W0AB36_9STRA|nr:hypothetical protein THRCLA_00481 [Thraustotheca clavata]
MALPSETPFVESSANLAGIPRKLVIYGVLIIFLLINVIVLYSLHFTAAGVPVSASNVKVSNVGSSKSGSIDNKVVSFADDGSIVVGAGTTAFLDAVAMPTDDVSYIMLAPTSANASTTAIFSYFLKNKTSSIITTLTVNDDKTTTVNSKVNTLAGVQVRGIATLTDKQVVFLQSTSMGIVSLVPGSISNGAVTLLTDKAVNIATNSVSNTLAALSATTFVGTTYDPYSSNSTYYQNIQAGTINSEGAITMYTSMPIGTGNNALQSVTSSAPEPVAAIPNGFVISWFTSSFDPNSTSTSGLCVTLGNINGTAVGKIKETCNKKYQPQYFVDSTTLSNNVVAFSFYDSNNNNALTIVTVEINTFTKSIYFRGSYVLSSVAGPFDFGSFYSFYPTPYVQALSSSRLSIFFLNPNNEGRPTTQIFQVTDSFELIPSSPLMRLSNGDFTLAGTLEKQTSGAVSLTILPVSKSSFLAAYSGSLADVNHKRVSLVEFKGKPIGIGSGSDGLVMSGVVKVGSNYVAGKEYYATTQGDILAATQTDNGAEYFFVGNTTIVSKDARVGVALAMPAATSSPWTVFVCSEISGATRACVEVCVRVMGGRLVQDIAEAVAAEEASDSKGTRTEGYIICMPQTYATYAKVRESHYIPLVTPLWIFRSVLHNARVLLPTEKFSASPRKLFSSIVLYTSQVEAEPAKVIRALITHCGGQVLTSPSRSATHMICLRPEGHDYQQAMNWNAEGSMLQVDTLQEADVHSDAVKFLEAGCVGPIPDRILTYMMGKCHLNKHHIVNYNWVQESVLAKRLYPEKLYGFDSTYTPTLASNITLPDIVTALQRETHLFPNSSESTPIDIWKDVSQNSANLWNAETFVLSNHITTFLRHKMIQAVVAMGANIINTDEENIDEASMQPATFVVCAYQTGRVYTLAKQFNKKIVGIQWLAACLAVRTLMPVAFQEPSIRNVLWYPAKQFGSVPGMEGMIVTLSGFTARTTPSRDDMQAIIRLSGACWLPVLSRSHTTHLICLEPTGEKYKKSLTWNCQNIVKFEWILQCVKQWEYVSEDNYLWAPKAKVRKFDVSDALDALDDKAKEVTPAKPKEKFTGEESKLITPVMLRAAEMQPPIATEPEMPKPKKALTRKSQAQATTPVVDTSTTVVVDTKAAKKTSSRKAKVQEVVVEDTEPSAKPAPKSKAKETSASMAKTKVAEPPASKAKTKAKTKAEKHASKAKSKAEEVEKPPAKKGSKRKAEKSIHEATDDEVVVVKQRRTTQAPTRLFLLTGTQEEMAINESIIQFLGGTVLQSKRAFDPSCTHVICKEFRRTEKIIAACASGKWILTPQYLTDSRKKGIFLDEEPYEWGLNKVSKKTYMDPRVWPPVAKYWRTEIAAGRPRALDQWTIAIFGETLPPPPFCEQVISAGGGTVVDVKKMLQKFQPGIDGPPMIVLVADSVKKTDKVMKIVIQSGIPRVKPNFIIEYITRDQTCRPQLQDYYCS